MAMTSIKKRAADVGVAVVGAGIGGLTLALALRERGITAEVFERATRLTEVGAAVALAANGSRILIELGLGARLGAVATVPDQLRFRHWADGRLLAVEPVGRRYDERYGAPFWGLHRARLQQVLSEASGPEHLHLGRGLRGITSDADAATLQLEDGSTVRAEIVVGADGGRLGGEALDGWRRAVLHRYQRLPRSGADRCAAGALRAGDI